MISSPNLEGALSLHTKTSPCMINNNSNSGGLLTKTTHHLRKIEAFSTLCLATIGIRQSVQGIEEIRDLTASQWGPSSLGLPEILSQAQICILREASIVTTDLVNKTICKASTFSKIVTIGDQAAGQDQGPDQDLAQDLTLDLVKEALCALSMSPCRLKLV